MTVTFCRRLNWGLLASCLETYTGRLGFGVRDELLPLVRMGSEVRKLEGNRERGGRVEGEGKERGRGKGREKEGND